MYDVSYVLGLLRANAADLERRALSGEKTNIARIVTERTLRNRALAITHRLQGAASTGRAGLAAAECHRARLRSYCADRAPKSFDWSHEVLLINGTTVTVKVAHVR